MKKVLNFIIRTAIYFYVFILIGIVPYFFLNYSGEKMEKIASESKLRLMNETQLKKENPNEKTKCRHCPHAHQCADRSKCADSTSGTSTDTKSQ